MQTDSVFGPVVYAYTRAQAIEDGVLVDLTAAAPDVCGQHFPSYQVACTASVWAIIDKAIHNPKWMNDLNGVVHDICYMSKMSGAMLDEFTKLFQVIITGAGRRRLFAFKMTSGPDENGTPCLTVMLPEED